jgi:hypothetical protein
MTRGRRQFAGFFAQVIETEGQKKCAARRPEFHIWPNEMGTDSLSGEAGSAIIEG